MTEVLQEFRSERDFNQARKILVTFEFVELGGFDVARLAAINFRAFIGLESRVFEYLTIQVRRLIFKPLSISAVKAWESEAIG